MEIETMDTHLEAFHQHGLMLSRMITGSKSSYRRTNPNNLVMFNANIFTEEDGKIWFGDLDITLDSDKLKSISKEISKKLYILNEHLGRWSNTKIDLMGAYFIVDGDNLVKNY